LRKSDKLKFQCLKIIDGLKVGWCNAKGLKSHGGYWMHNTGECPNEEKESFLSQILEDTPQEKYYLSAKACQGILRRAEKRGKQLPQELKEALERQSMT
jgi:hypothetical protein